MSIRPPQFVHPAAGGTDNESFQITLDGIPSSDCVSIIQGQATILISRKLLEHLSAAKPEKWKTEQERMALIRGARAQGILQSLTKSIDNDGCTTVQTPVPDDSLYLISELLQSGQVGIIDNQTHKSVGHIFVNFSGFMAGPLAGRGHISYSFTQKSAPFLLLRWWTS